MKTSFVLKEISEIQDKLLLIDANDIAYPLALNMFDIGQDRLQTLEPIDREKILNGTIDLYEYIFSSLLGAELTQKARCSFRLSSSLDASYSKRHHHYPRGFRDWRQVTLKSGC